MIPYYSILIPIHNERDSISSLLESLAIFKRKGNEILIIDDGSTDGSTELLKKSKLINLISLNTNKGKGFAIQQGLQKAKFNKILIFDGDLELDPLEISKLMILNRSNGIHCVMGYRFANLNPIISPYNWGNFMFTSFFNIFFKSNHRDILCCAKSFYLDEIKKKYVIKSNGFDIDVELSSILTFINKNKLIPQVLLKYNRRNINEGKKLQISDGWIILARTIRMIKYL